MLRAKTENLEFEPILHDHAAFIEHAEQREGFIECYEALSAEYEGIRETLLAARSK